MGITQRCGKSPARPVKATVKKRSLNAGTARKTKGAGFNEQDPKRRLGNFETAGEHARQGGRRSGIVGRRVRNKGN
jgi:hypothetical protein